MENYKKILPFITPYKTNAVLNVTFNILYALFSSLMLLLPKFIAGYSGAFVDAYGYSQFFTSTALLGLPVLVLVALASRFAAKATTNTGAADRQ